MYAYRKANEETFGILMQKITDFNIPSVGSQTDNPENFPAYALFKQIDPEKKIFLKIFEEFHPKETMDAKEFLYQKSLAHFFNLKGYFSIKNLGGCNQFEGIYRNFYFQKLIEKNLSNFPLESSNLASKCLASSQTDDEKLALYQSDKCAFFSTGYIHHEVGGGGCFGMAFLLYVTAVVEAALQWRFIPSMKHNFQKRHLRH